MRSRKQELMVGVLMLLGIIAFAFLALQVSGLSTQIHQSQYTITANFDNIGDLKIRAPVTIAGVRVGEVAAIRLEPSSLRAEVIMRIDGEQNQIPSGSSAQVLTQGVLGANYIGLTPSLAEASGYLKEGSVITETQSALILENLVGQLIYNMKKD